MTDASSSSAPGDAVLAELEALHGAVDAEAERLARTWAAPLACRRGCAACCVDELTVFSVEAARIRRAHGSLLRAGRPHPGGRCAFLDEAQGCRIYEVRPYVCRTQGLPLRWLDEGPDGSLVEYRDVCELNEEALDLVALEPTSCWTIGPVEARLRQLEQRYGAGPLQRIALRDLFGLPG